MTAAQPVDDDAVDLIEPRWTYDRVDARLRGRVSWPPEVDPDVALVVSVVNVHDVSDLFGLARALVEGSAHSWDVGGIAITDDGVVVWDALDHRTRTSTRAMARLLARSIARAEAADPERLSDAGRRLLREVTDLARRPD